MPEPAHGRKLTSQPTPHNTAFTVLYNRTISPTLLNEARFNFTKFAFNEIESSSQTNFGIPRIEIESLFRDGSRIRFGANQAETTPGVFSEKTLEFRDIVSNVRGNHGLEVWRRISSRAQ